MKNLLPRIVISFAILMVIVMVYELNKERKEVYRESQKKISYRDSIIKIQGEKIQELEMTQEVIISTLQLREEEMEFWINVSNLYKNNREKQAQKIAGPYWRGNP